MNKRGTHVEIIISFIIFIIFLVFVLAAIKSPVTNVEDKKDTFDSIEMGILEQVSADMTTLTVNIGDESELCLSLNNFLSLSNIGPNIIVKDYYENVVPAHVNGDSLEITRESTEDTFFKIYYSEEFNPLGSGSGCTGVSNYDIGFTKTDEYVFEDKFTDFLNQDYGTARNLLKVPEGTEFGYGIVLADKSVEETTQQEVSTNIYIRETPVEYIDSDGNILEGYVRTKIW